MVVIALARAPFGGIAAEVFAGPRIQQLLLVKLLESEGLEVDEASRRTWGRFWEWLGVATLPRVLVDEVAVRNLHRDRWRSIRTKHPHAGTGLWREYLEQAEAEHADCPSHGRDYRQLRRSVALEKFADFVELRQFDQLSLAYELLAEGWGQLKKALPSLNE